MGHITGAALCLEIKQVLTVGVGNQPVGALCVIKFNTWKNAFERFADHESSKYRRHRDSVLKAESISMSSNGFRKRNSVAVQLNHEAKQQILDNRRKITPLSSAADKEFLEE